MRTAPSSQPRLRTFAIGEHDFLLDGEPYRVLAGALHYFRVHPGQWADRILKAKQMGLNTIETYVPWNAHSPQRGTFDATDGLDLGRFLDLVLEAGMHAIVRPGPYICAEWDNGGLPAWLFQDESVGIRRDEPLFMSAVESFYRDLAPILVPRQIDLGGPIILVQVENEYGAYGSDKSYLRKLVELTREIGITVPLTTVDQPMDNMLEKGSLPELHKTGSFGSRVSERLATLRRHQPTGPLMCSEFWDGWFDDWGFAHHVTSAATSAADLDELLAHGASVNIYMFHGGTNFGFTNGANDKGTYRPITTSYDYDAPLDEAGNPTAKYWTFRDVLARYGDVPESVPVVAEPAEAFSVPLESSADLWSVAGELGDWTLSDVPVSADALGQLSGFTVYRANLPATGGGELHLDEVRDRVLVFSDGALLGSISRELHETTLQLPAGTSSVDLLVEDQGRVDYGPRIGEQKGIVGRARLGDAEIRGWRARGLPLGDIATSGTLRVEQSGSATGARFWLARFDLAREGDLFLDTAAWTKGVVWINGFCLGRYWSRGPQRTLYVPAPILRSAGNELVLFELEAIERPLAEFVEAADLGPSD